MISQSQLRAFHQVALSGGFSRAAAALNITQPAISEQVRKLEEDFDVQLFNRERRQVELTDHGEKLFILTKRYFDIEDEIGDFLSESSANIEGTLRISADSVFHIVDILAQFHETYPNINVVLKTGNSQTILEELRSYSAEIGVVGSFSPGSEFDIQSLGASNIVAFVSKSFFKEPKTSITLAELSNWPLIFREDGSKTRRKLEREVDRLGLTLKPIIEAEGREAVRELVASGAGIGFVSEAEFGHDVRLERLELSDVDLKMRESLICLKRRHDVRIIRTFMDFSTKFTNAVENA